MELGIVYIFMEFISGGSLHSILKRLVDIKYALTHLHARAYVQIFEVLILHSKL